MALPDTTMRTSVRRPDAPRPLVSRIEPDLATPLKLIPITGNGYRTTASQFGDLPNELANRAASGGDRDRLSGPWAADIKKTKIRGEPRHSFRECLSLRCWYLRYLEQ